ncbi:unnamed protein product [Sphagnum jensenii]
MKERFACLTGKKDWTRSAAERGGGRPAGLLPIAGAVLRTIDRSSIFASSSSSGFFGVEESALRRSSTLKMSTSSSAHEEEQDRTNSSSSAREEQQTLKVECAYRSAAFLQSEKRSSRP